MKSERKEIIVVNGFIIFLLMATLANAVVLGAAYRWYEHRQFSVEKLRTEEYGNWLMNVRKEKNMVVKLEGAPNWNATIYVRMHPESMDVGER